MRSGNYPTESGPKQTGSAEQSQGNADPAKPDGLVLCGGAGRRFGGIDKAWLTVDGEPMVARALRLLQPLCSNIAISANRNLQDYARFAPAAVLTDRRPGYPGPLAGIEAMAGHCQSDRLLLLPCDLPYLSKAVPAALLDALNEDSDVDYVIAKTPGHKHYLCAALRRHCLAGASEQLDRGRHAVRDWFGLYRGKTLCFDGETARGFRNLNSDQDLCQPDSA
jgi:molybdopterin-guanine dinucleotide biosynthesis protein A